MQCPQFEDLESFLDGRMPVVRRDSLAAHLDTCSSCKRLALDIESNLQFARRIGLGETRAIAVAGSSAQPAAGILTLPTTTDDDAPPALPGYRFRGVISRGGQGVVYEATQASTQRRVAVKFLRQGHFADAHDLARFEREVLVLGRLRHPNIVAIHDSGTCGGHAYFVMDYIEGEPLDAFVARRNAPLRETLELFAQTCDGVHAAHLHGVIHRDLKPANVRIDTSGRPHILDFGLAKLATASEEDAGAGGMTQTGQFVGSLPWSSPEQADGLPSGIDLRTDVYALGVILYQLLARKFPYDLGGGIHAALLRIRMTTPEPIRRHRPDLDADVATIVMKCLEKAPDRRYQSAGDLARDIRHFLAGEPIEARRDSAAYLARKLLWRYRAPAAVAAAFVLLITGSTIALSVLYQKERTQSEALQTARRREADDLLGGLFDRLVYRDYHSDVIDEPLATLEAAAALGADPRKATLTRAIALIGVGEPRAAIDALAPLLDQHPHDAELRFARAWASAESGEPAQASELVEQADGRAPADTAAAWFFRGMALNRSNPVEAIESHRRAIAARNAEGELFPQAVVHLARANNQRAYSRRELDGFEAARAGLEHVIEFGPADVYPHYLLSIAHRLAGDILRDQRGPDDPDVRAHYDAALAAATRGQQAGPDNERAITAEAECLESMGRFSEAAEARTRAIDRAELAVRKHEGLHYRWRLLYWLGHHDEALADLARIETVFASGESQALMYGCVYPAIVLADSGRLNEASQRVDAFIGTAAPRITNALWFASLLRILGRTGDADALIRAHRNSSSELAGEADAVRDVDWLETMLALTLGEIGLDDALDRAGSGPTANKRVAEACFHAACIALGDADRERARELFARAVACYDGEQAYTFHAKAILVRMRDDPHWPSWFSADRDEVEAEDAP